MEPDQIRSFLREALVQIRLIEDGLTTGKDPDKARVGGKPIGKRGVLFAIQDIDDARDALFECGRRYGFTPQDLEL